MERLRRHGQSRQEPTVPLCAERLGEDEHLRARLHARPDEADDHVERLPRDGGHERGRLRDVVELALDGRRLERRDVEPRARAEEVRVVELADPPEEAVLDACGIGRVYVFEWVDVELDFLCLFVLPDECELE